MNILYEEGGNFKVAIMLDEQPMSLMAETPQGKRFKIKKNQIFMTFEHADLGSLIADAQQISDQLDIDFLWECAPGTDIDFIHFAKDYFGQNCSTSEMIGMLMKLFSMPIYFHRKSRGVFEKAQAENLKAALAGLEKKRKQQAFVDDIKQQLLSGSLPDVISGQIHTLLYRPDKNSLEYKALDAACQEKKVSHITLLHQLGAIPSPYKYHLNRFLFDHFPNGTQFETFDLPDVDTSHLPIAFASGFTIDDETTTEYDDAFSVQWLDDATVEIGIHISTPALFIPLDSPIDQMARKRLSTVYMPGDKITMFPDNVVAAATLAAGKLSPVLSHYQTLRLTENGQFEMLEHRSLLERLHIDNNFSNTAIEQALDELVSNEQIDEQIKTNPIALLYKAAVFFQSIRAEKLGKPITNDRIDYNFYVIDEMIRISERNRGNPLDVLVSEMMILLNSRWSAWLKEAETGAIYRTQGSGKVKTSTIAEPHSVLGVDCYAWCSAPLRRYIDFTNQRQLLALAQSDDPSYTKQDERLFSIIQDFEIAYTAYNDFQTHIERYWCLRWLEQEKLGEVSAVVIRDQTARIDGIPITVKTKSLPAGSIGQTVRLHIESIDYWDLSLYVKYIAD